MGHERFGKIQITCTDRGRLLALLTALQQLVLVQYCPVLETQFRKLQIPVCIKRVTQTKNSSLYIKLTCFCKDGYVLHHVALVPVAQPLHLCGANFQDQTMYIWSSGVVGTVVNSPVSCMSPY